MKVGIGLPNGGLRVDAESLVRLAVDAETLGLDSVWALDRWLRPHAPVTMPGVPVPITMPPESYATVFDPLETLSFIAARTSRIMLGTSAINVLYHPPVLLAKRLATLDRLSGGRVIAGVTSGWMAEEFAVAGVPRTRMGDGFDDHLAAMRAVWGPDPVVHNGKYYPIPKSDIGPKPARPGGIPLVAGYVTEAGLRRAARIADGLHPYRDNFDDLAADLALWRETTEAAGRAWDSMPVVLRCTGSLRPAQGKLFSGSVMEWVEDLARLDELGVDHVFVQFGPEMGLDATLDVFSRVLTAAGR
ncbi:TIGR03619 family F420-dependent LLM class oxidoreductase [Amycolatopsis sp.]|jgi:probable F420-dependent oxidoreductase|uniref:TIGR03619 family F420-dependent LLM class oxidoreductase n=1 Tax=Amycolatopsis sp. TaxID=37632 RepID=UPI002DF88C80|nr:TIGR03619 family F420-dependent LLM class oxidoreductase [Amycolatopsis sp.]